MPWRRIPLRQGKRRRNEPMPSEESAHFFFFKTNTEKSYFFKIFLEKGLDKSIFCDIIDEYEFKRHAALAQLDRVLGYEPKGRGFESLTPCQNKEITFVISLFCYGVTVERAPMPMRSIVRRNGVKQPLRLGSESLTPCQKILQKRILFCSIFLSKSQTWHIIAAGVYHHALACISSPKVYSSAT